MTGGFRAFWLLINIYHIIHLYFQSCARCDTCIRSVSVYTCTHTHTHLDLSPSARSVVLLLVSFFYRYTFCSCTPVCVRMHAHHVRCFHTLALALCCIHPYTHLHARLTALASSLYARSFHLGSVRSGCSSWASPFPRTLFSSSSTVRVLNIADLCQKQFQQFASIPFHDDSPSSVMNFCSPHSFMPWRTRRGISIVVYFYAACGYSCRGAEVLHLVLLLLGTCAL